MIEHQTSEAMRHEPGWPHRLAFSAAVVLLWAGLYYGVDGLVRARGMDSPTLALVRNAIAAAPVILILLMAGAGLVEVLCGRRDGMCGLLMAGWGLALWAFPGGTMDDWLIMRNPVAGPPTGGVYLALLAEYAFWAVAVAAVVAVSAWMHRTSTGSAGWRKLYGLDTSPAALRDGITALVVTVVVSATLMFILTGPRVGHTYRGQVYFAVAAAFILGVVIGERVTRVRGPIWYIPAPLIVGIVGVVLASARPALPAVYERINVIPAWGLVRPLPVEMVGVGLVAIVLTLRASTRLSSETGRD